MPPVSFVTFTSLFTVVAPKLRFISLRTVYNVTVGGVVINSPQIGTRDKETDTNFTLTQ